MLVPLSNKISEVKLEAGYKSTDIFKFDTNSRPIQVSIESATEAKKKIIQLCCEFECLFISYVALHKIIGSQDQSIQNTWALDHVIGRFQRFLSENNSYGIVAVDNLPIEGEFQYHTKKHSEGLHIDGKTVPLDRIKLFSSTCIGASHVASAMDIVLGSFRYCINEPSNVYAAKEMIRKVVQLMWHETNGDSITILEKGFILRPKMENIRVLVHKQAYHTLLEQLRDLLRE